MNEFTCETVFVAGTRVFAVRVNQRAAPRLVTVTVAADGKFQWSFEEPGWRPLAFGSSRDAAYIWSARGLITLPQSDTDEPEVIRIDEDILYVFEIDAGWVLVCETSVRRHIGGAETDRIELGDVVESASCRDDLLVIKDAGGGEHRIAIVGPGLLLDR